MGRSLLVLASLADNAVVSAGAAGRVGSGERGSAAGEQQRCEEGPGGPAVAGDSGAPRLGDGVSGSCWGV